MLTTPSRPPGPFNEPVTSAICIINNTDRFMYVKMLVTNPDPFRVRPNMCVINPRALQVFAAILEPVKDLKKLEKHKNKFMIEYSESESNEQAPEKFFKTCSKFSSIKLNSVFEQD